MSSFQLAPPACFLEENGCRKGQDLNISYCITPGHKATTAYGDARCCEDAYAFERQEAVSGTSSSELYAVFDGHGGRECAHSVAEWLPSAVWRVLNCGLYKSIHQALEKAFQEVDEKWVLQQRARDRPDISGSTATMVFCQEGRLHFAHVGDSRAVLCSDGIAGRMTRDHRAGDPAEVDRVRGYGGSVQQPSAHDDSARVNGQLEVTRSFGDVELKSCIKAEPDYHEHTLTEKDEFLILATDGLWDALDDQTAVRLVLEHVKQCKRDMTPAEMLARRAFRERSMDDIGVLVVLLQEQHAWQPAHKRLEERRALLFGRGEDASSQEALSQDAFDA